MEIVARSLLVALCAAPWACRSDEAARTEILLVVDSDLRVPDQLDRIDVRVEGPDGSKQNAYAELDTATNSLPRSVALVHEGGALGPLHATVHGVIGGRPVLTREARLSFVEGQTLVLPMHLVARCIGVECGAGTCTERGCERSEIDANSLTRYTGAEPRLIGVDGGDRELDAGELDAGDDDAAMAGDGPIASEDASTREDASDDGAVEAGESDASIAQDGGIAPESDAGMCMPVPESCNARDDDCDGEIDDGFDLTSDPNHCGSCATRCTGLTRLCCGSVCRTLCN